jgi:hypothetical protein
VANLAGKGDLLISDYDLSNLYIPDFSVFSKKHSYNYYDFV